VANFLRYVDAGFYSGTVFHRAVPTFVVQGGGVDRQLRLRSTSAPVANESDNGLRNARGTIAAARTEDPGSATAQFFVNLDDNRPLDGGREPGYTVFGRVKEGMSVFEEISRLPTGAAGPFRADVPTPLVAIESIARLDETALAAFPAEGREAALSAAISAAAAANDAAEALRLIGHYRAVCGADEPEIAVTEARMALATGDRRRAVFALEELFATTDRDHPLYESATALYREATPDAEPIVVQLVAGCATPAPPAMPDAATATMEEMVASQSRVRAFVAAGETYLTCLSKVIDDEQHAAEERNAAVSEHNRMVTAMEEIAAAFNEQLRIFKARG
jgi:cyclophilin family peptidyl-prolyl cis-trans isomerase